MSDRTTSYEGHVTDAWMARQMGCGVRPAGDCMDQIFIVTTSGQASTNNGAVVGGRPRGLLTVLDNDGVSREQRADDRTNEIVKRIAAGVLGPIRVGSS
nr:hypothetical protein CFP56_07513 [Quercus suber]